MLTTGGLATTGGLLSINDPVMKFFLEDPPEKPGESLKAMQIWDRTLKFGRTRPTPRAPTLMTGHTFGARPIPFKRGALSLFNTPAGFMHCAIVQ